MQRTDVTLRFGFGYHEVVFASLQHKPFCVFLPDLEGWITV